jgi:tetratricopeptide (TPR) repeat protein
VRWDGASAVLHHTLGRVLNARGKNAEAEAALAKAAELEPTNAEHVYTLALLYAETGRVPDALAALKKTVAIDPRFGRAWYNLGLAYAQRNLPDEALDALRRAEALMPASPDPPHAQASIYSHLGDARQARAAADRAARLRRP